MKEYPTLSEEQKFDILDLQKMLSDDAAKRWFGGFFHMCGLYNSVLCDNPIETAYKAGRQDIGKMVYNCVMSIDPRIIAACESSYREFIELVNKEKDEEDVYE
jgi:hypothetical protein